MTPNRRAKSNAVFPSDTSRVTLSQRRKARRAQVSQCGLVCGLRLREGHSLEQLSSVCWLVVWVLAERSRCSEQAEQRAGVIAVIQEVRGGANEPVHGVEESESLLLSRFCRSFSLRSIEQREVLFDGLVVRPRVQRKKPRVGSRERNDLRRLPAIVAQEHQHVVAAEPQP